MVSKQDAVILPPSPQSCIHTRSIRVRALLVVLFVQLSLLIWLVSRDPILSFRLRHAFPMSFAAVHETEDHTAHMKNDPESGAIIPKEMSVQLARLTSGPPYRGFLIIPVGDCASCIRVDLNRAKQGASERLLRLALLTTAKPEISIKYSQGYALNGAVIHDPYGRIHRSLNVAWLGRAYLVSNDFRIRWLQRDWRPGYVMFKDPTFEAEVKELHK